MKMKKSQFAEGRIIIVLKGRQAGAHGRSVPHVRRNEKLTPERNEELTPLF